MIMRTAFIRSLAILFLMTLAAGSSLYGANGLSFDESRIEVTAAPEAKTVTVPYFFTNNTDRTITIKRYDSACSCLSAKVKGGKLSYQPGEQGEIKVVFELGTFSGLVEKTVLIWTTEDEDKKPSSILSVVINIPVLFEVNPKTSFWEQHGDGQAQVIQLKINSHEPIHILEHGATNKNFDYELKTIKEGFEYQLVVKPKDTNTPAFGMIKLTTDSSIPRYRRQMAFVCVRRQPAPPSTPPAKP